MKSSSFRSKGFTLVEIAIVLLIVTVLLGYTVAMFPMQQDLKKYRPVDREVDEIIEHLIAFAQVNGRLPCPDTSGGVGTIDGEEDRNAGLNGCEAYFGFLPGETLGINGKYDDTGVLIDPWSQRYGYAVSEVEVVVGGDKVLVTPNGVRDAGIANVTPDLFVCSDSNVLGVADANCTDVGSNQVVGNVAAVVVSLGKDYELPASSNIQAENADDFHDGTNDKVYVFTGRRDDFDDVVKWVSTNLLYSRMIAAEQLP
jgi:prepilin-type N-terminal cleavage/methylation domain-containing protein